MRCAAAAREGEEVEEGRWHRFVKDLEERVVRHKPVIQHAGECSRCSADSDVPYTVICGMGQ